MDPQEITINRPPADMTWNYEELANFWSSNIKATLSSEKKYQAEITFEYYVIARKSFWDRIFMRPSVKTLGQLSIKPHGLWTLTKGSEVNGIFREISSLWIVIPEWQRFVLGIPYFVLEYERSFSVFSTFTDKGMADVIEISFRDIVSITFSQVDPPSV